MNRGKQFWADGFFAETVGQREEQVIRRYIREQRSESEGDTGGEAPETAQPRR